MKKAKRCLTAVVSGVLAASAVLSGCGQSKKEVSLTLPTAKAGGFLFLPPLH